MFDLSDIVDSAIAKFFANLFEQLITFFATTLAEIMSTSINVLQIPLVQNGIKYAQSLAFVILVLKASNEAFQTYILHQNGDPDADPTGLLIRTGQAVAVIATSPWIVTQVFTFGTKVALDVAKLGTGKTGVADWTYLSALILKTRGVVVPLVVIIIAICMLVVSIQATIRGAELALMAVLGPILALNITANNRSTWSAWFKQLVIICVSQALQIFLLQGTFALLTSGSISSDGLIQSLGWIWVAIKSPKFVQQFAYSTGFTGTLGGAGKQAGTMYLTRKLMAG